MRFEKFFICAPILWVSISSADVTLTPATGQAILERIRSSGSKVVVVNLWATWCKPCVEEFPEILMFKNRHPAPQSTVFFVSMDFANSRKDVEEFLRNHKIDFETFMKKQKDEDFIREIDAKWSGTLPATLAFDTEGKLLKRFEGEVTYEKLSQQLMPYLEVRK